MTHLKIIVFTACVLFLSLAGCSTAPTGENAQAGQPGEKPGKKTASTPLPEQLAPDTFVVDTIGLIEERDRKEIEKTCAELSKERSAPIIVVTISSPSDHGGRSMSIADFAHMLYTKWGLGIPRRKGGPWNIGILLLVSRRERTARIELGSEWGARENDICAKILDRKIIPEFRKDEYSKGVREGVKAIAEMAR
ncbi:MAG: TPM domain-containing protein [Planctomycetota bacterium]|nr:MAG: TPM domain-containing protein [Planctomycetota bacterium]